jgi:hypothetical protein
MSINPLPKTTPTKLPLHNPAITQTTTQMTMIITKTRGKAQMAIKKSQERRKKVPLWTWVTPNIKAMSSRAISMSISVYAMQKPQRAIFDGKHRRNQSPQPEH